LRSPPSSPAASSAPCPGEHCRGVGDVQDRDAGDAPSRLFDELAAGAIGVGATLDILIPPSIAMVIYGVATQTSIGKL
jgi:hypothetical protein